MVMWCDLHFHFTLGPLFRDSPLSFLTLVRCQISRVINAEEDVSPKSLKVGYIQVRSLAHVECRLRIACLGVHLHATEKCLVL